MATPTNAPKNTDGFIKSNVISSPVEFDTISANAANSAITVSPAAPIANPFVIAFVVFPAESNSSALCITSSPKSPISASPLALSTIGPYASFETIIPTIDNIPIADIEIPSISYPGPIGSHNLYEISAANPIPTNAGKLLISPYEKPDKIVNAGPFCELFATLMTGFLSSPVK